jgi:hypothetical protein
MERSEMLRILRDLAKGRYDTADVVELSMTWSGGLPYLAADDPSLLASAW